MSLWFNHLSCVSVCQGLFRIAAGASKLKKLKAALDCSTSQLEEFYSDPHAVAGTLLRRPFCSVLTFLNGKASKGKMGTSSQTTHSCTYTNTHLELAFICPDPFVISESY